MRKARKCGPFAFSESVEAQVSTELSTASKRRASANPAMSGRLVRAACNVPGLEHAELELRQRASSTASDLRDDASHTRREASVFGSTAHADVRYPRGGIPRCLARTDQ